MKDPVLWLLEALIQKRRMEDMESIFGNNEVISLTPAGLLVCEGSSDISFETPFLALPSETNDKTLLVFYHLR